MHVLLFQYDALVTLFISMFSPHTQLLDAKVNAGFCFGQLWLLHPLLILIKITRSGFFFLFFFSNIKVQLFTTVAILLEVKTLSSVVRVLLYAARMVEEAG